MTERRKMSLLGVETSYDSPSDTLTVSHIKNIPVEQMVNSNGRILFYLGEGGRILSVSVLFARRGLIEHPRLAQPHQRII